MLGSFCFTCIMNHTAIGVHVNCIHTSAPAQQVLASDVQYDSRGIDSHKQLEKAVKNYSYPPTINSVVEYRKELKSKGRRTVVKLHISGMDRKMAFPCTAYEEIQGSWECCVNSLCACPNSSFIPASLGV